MFPSAISVPAITSVYLFLMTFETWCLICSYIRTYMYACVCAYVRTCVHMYACVRAYVRTCVRVYVRMYVRTYVLTYVRTYVRTHTHTAILQPMWKGNICARVRTKHYVGLANIINNIRLRISALENENIVNINTFT